MPNDAPPACDATARSLGTMVLAGPNHHRRQCREGRAPESGNVTWNVTWISTPSLHYPWCLPLAEILRVQPKKIASRYLGYLPPHIYPSSCFLYFGVVSEFYSPDTFTLKYKNSTCSWLSVPRNFIQEGFWYMKQFKQGFWTFCLEGIVRDRSPNPQGSC